jgi:hypothetical protein
MKAKLVSDILNEAEITEEKPLSSGERAALKQGLDLITTPQMASLYLVAKYRLAKREDKSSTFAGQMAQKMNRKVEEEDFRALPYGRLADVLDMNPLTVSRSTNKFMHLLQGTETASEILYPKIINAFDEFEKMQEGEVWAIAEEAINMLADTSKSDAFGEKNSEEGKKARDKAKKEQKEMGRAIRSLFLTLKETFKSEPIKAAKMTATKLSSELGLSVDKIKDIARLEFKNDPVMLRYWK